MINNCIKNICLISFALIGPISLPAGGIQRNINEYSTCDNSKEIVLNADYSFHCFPEDKSKRLRILSVGSSVSILKNWVGKDNTRWLRVKLCTSLIDSPNRPTRGWIKI